MDGWVWTTLIEEGGRGDRGLQKGHQEGETMGNVKQDNIQYKKRTKFKLWNINVRLLRAAYLSGELTKGEKVNGYRNPRQ